MLPCSATGVREEESGAGRGGWAVLRKMGWEGAYLRRRGGGGAKGPGGCLR